MADEYGIDSTVWRNREGWQEDMVESHYDSRWKPLGKVHLSDSMCSDVAPIGYPKVSKVPFQAPLHARIRSLQIMAISSQMMKKEINTKIIDLQSSSTLFL